MKKEEIYNELMRIICLNTSCTKKEKEKLKNELWVLSENLACDRLHIETLEGWVHWLYRRITIRDVNESYYKNYIRKALTGYNEDIHDSKK